MQFPCLFLVSKYDFGRKWYRLTMRSWPWKGVKDENSAFCAWPRRLKVSRSESPGPSILRGQKWEWRHRKGPQELGKEGWSVHHAQHQGMSTTERSEATERCSGMKNKKALLNPIARMSLVLGIHLFKVQGLKRQWWWQKKELVICDSWCCHFYSLKKGRVGVDNNNHPFLGACSGK